MTGPIPVFSFVFAAYAATSGAVLRAARADARAPLDPRAPFRAVWRAQSARGAAVFAKIGIVRGSEPDGLHLAVGAGSEEFWVGGIVESGLGFVGAPVNDQQCPPEVTAGRQVRFHGIHVLDWRVGGRPLPDNSPAP